MAGTYAHPESLVTTDWVAQNLSNPKVVLAEVDVDTTAYEQGHILGAVGWHWKNQLQDTVTREILSKAQVEKLLSDAGISNDQTVVLYGDNNNWFAAWAFWLLRVYGHRDLKLMNGGRAKWLAENRPLTKDAANRTPTQYRAANANTSLRALRDYVMTGVSKAGSVKLVDVRSPQEYKGELLAPAALPQEGAQRGGHIPGAQNIPWGTAVAEDGTFKSHDDLKKIYGDKGIAGDREVIAYCRIGERSAHTWFALSQLLGYQNVRNYDGSWTEWGSLVGAPIEK
ncbi:MAG: sulfurtransferase [Chloroflexi bacterium]|nr:sulfurtransferase [Chloroflexota bacterium]